MNAQEKQQLNQLLNQLIEVRLAEKDSEADNLIIEAVSRQPDAAYLLIQRCLIQDQALNAAQIQIAELQRQLQQKHAASSNVGFLDENPWSSTSSDAKEVPGAASYRMPSKSVPDNPAHTHIGQDPVSGFGPGFLGNVASTAAGVAAGSFLFQGIGNLLGHHPTYPSIWGQQSTSEHMAEQTTINNYYGDSNQPGNNEDNHAYLASYDDANLIDDSDLDSDWI
ncbi:DUF2076 domain-containing protein [Methylomonas sp. MgM2]